MEKITGQMLRAMIEKVLEDYEILAPLPLAAEPTQNQPEPPEEIVETIHSYKGNKTPPNYKAVAIKALGLCSDKERQEIFSLHNVMSYDQFLASVQKYERAKKA